MKTLMTRQRQTNMKDPHTSTLTLAQMPRMVPLPMKDPGLRKWKLTEDFYLWYRGRQIVIPEDFIFDGASIPKVFRALYNPTGYLLIASLVHDYCYQFARYTVVDFNLVFTVKVDRQQADELFFGVASRYYPSHRGKTWLAKKALDIGGGSIWDKNRKVYDL